MLEQHAAKLASSGIADEVGAERGYYSVEQRSVAMRIKHRKAPLPALAIPIHATTGEYICAQLRPDQPLDGRKYLWPYRQPPRVDVPKQVRPMLGDPGVPLYVTEGALKADAAVSHGLCCIALPGVWTWRGTNGDGGRVLLADFESIAINGRDVVLCFDSDVMTNPQVHEAMARLAAVLKNRNAHVGYVYLPPGEHNTKVGLDDFLLSRPASELLALTSDTLRRPPHECRSENEGELPSPPATHELLDEIEAFMSTYVKFPSGHASAFATLFVAHTWAFDAAYATPYVVIESAEKQSGKTRLEEVFALVAHSALHTASATEAALYQLITAQRPTLLIDEVDRLLRAGGDRAELVFGVINAGNRPGAKVYRGGREGDPITFDVYCPKVLAGIATDKLPDTVRDRGFTIPMRRKRRDEHVERFRERRARERLGDLPKRARSWAKDRHAELERYEVPSIPELSERKEEGAEPLLAIASLAGDLWWKRAREAVIALGTGDDDDSTSWSHRVLAATRDAFKIVDAISTHDLCAHLNTDDELPFGGWRDGRGIDPRTLAKQLKPYGIRSRTVRLDEDRTPKGFKREQFTDAWDRYLEPTQSSRDSAGQQLVDTSSTSTVQSQTSGSWDPPQAPVVADNREPEIAHGPTDVADVALRNAQLESGETCNPSDEGVEEAVALRLEMLRERFGSAR